MYGNSQTPLNLLAFSSQPLSFVNPEVTNELGSIQAIHLLEHGPALARTHWQTSQLNNLLSFARTRSDIWSRRLPINDININEMGCIKPLTRQELACQVTSEGALIQPEDGQEVRSYASSGSTGTPIRVHYLTQNARYNELRSIAQYLIEGRSLQHNRTFIKPANATQLKSSGNNLLVDIQPTWLGQLSSMFKGGHHKIIQVLRPDKALIEELRAHPVGYLACLGSQMDWLLECMGDSIRELGICMWLHHSDNINHKTRARLNELGIPSQSIYSCSEVGLIGFECSTHPHHYHVAHSNVIVEASSDSVDCDGQFLNKLLVTHLHSYATPLIRYELGDYGKVLKACPCGHDGTTLAQVYGRKKFFIQTSKGAVFFPFFSAPLQSIIDLKEISMRQLKLNEVEVDIISDHEISTESFLLAQSYLKSTTSEEIKFNLRQVKDIDWSNNPKRLPFVCQIQIAE